MKLSLALTRFRMRMTGDRLKTLDQENGITHSLLTWVKICTRLTLIIIHTMPLEHPHLVSRLRQTKTD